MDERGQQARVTEGRVRRQGRRVGCSARQDEDKSVRDGCTQPASVWSDKTVRRGRAPTLARRDRAPRPPDTGGGAAQWGSPRWAAARAIGCRLQRRRGRRDLRGSGAAAATPHGGGGVNEITAGVWRSSEPHTRSMNRRRLDAGQRTWPWHGRPAQPPVEAHEGHHGACKDLMTTTTTTHCAERPLPNTYIST